ncbi:type VI secretion system baseplate subunit TssF [Paraburkholderia sp. Ac-20340]|uniref:type VI secretion system baseplate subunit TssF n=1 Tax=Paraburkholderia sp. Ac-20340 TaxID=2703888 RepID=UPI0019822A7F|nr:type VI secretion system baseplate subunit TssF [Paraburkholderia sp. Ac-20340]MBN3854747.1 type VI secretion system baseplate subunit TssF [Paraburkholderia sp. Ac-20340]
MNNLLPHYEYEIGLLSRGLNEFAQRHPKIGARLGISNGMDDLHVDRMIQTFALLAARVEAKIEDSFPEFTQALLEVLYPEFLRTVPACAIAQFDPTAISGQLTAPLVVPRGTTLDGIAVPCRFRTVYDIALSPLLIHSARYAPATLAPSAVRLPTDTTGTLSVTFASATASGIFDATIPAGSIRTHIFGERALVNSTMDALLLHASAAFVEVDHCGHWLALDEVPVDMAGFSEDEHLLPPEAARTSGAPRSLREYFAFPEKFNFLNIDLGRIRRAANSPEARLLTLHVALRDIPMDSIAAQALNGLDASAFKLFCSPIVNLFRCDASPIPLTGSDTAYPVTPVPLQSESALDVYSIDAVHLNDRMQSERENAQPTQRVEVSPYRTLTHGESLHRSTTYWTAFRDPDHPGDASRAQLLISLVDLNGEIARVSQQQMDVEVTATNGDQPSHMSIGTPASDLLHEGAALTCPIRLLTRPTLPGALPQGQDALWRVIAGLAQRPFDRPQTGLAALKEFLKLHAPRTSSSQRTIDAIVGLEYRPALRWMSLACRFPSFVRGVEIHITLDENAMRNNALSLFSRILDQFFAPYAQANSYVQVLFQSAQTGKHLLMCAPQPGTHPLI